MSIHLRAPAPLILAADIFYSVGLDGGVAFLQGLEVNVLPLVQFYAGGKRVETFPCGPRKIELLREKLEKWQNWYARGTLKQEKGGSRQSDV